MTQRRFGPILAPGVVVIEEDAEKAILPAATGVNCYFGKLLKGDVGELIACPTKSDMLAKVGGYVDGSEVPDAAFDFFNLSNGRGEMNFVRLTDGTEVEAEETFYSRHIGEGFYAGFLSSPTFSETKRALVKVKAHNGGRWGGRGRVLTGEVATVATDITETTVDTAETMLVDEYAGATLRLLGVTSKTYVVLSNTAAGVLTVESDSTMATDLALGTDPTNAGYEVELDSEILEYPTSVAGTRRALSIRWKDGEEDETAYFGMEIYEDEALVRDYPNLSMDPTNKWYIADVINEDLSNFWNEIEVLYTGGITADIRPADWYGAAVDWASDTLTVRIAHVRSVSSTNSDPGWVGNFTLPSGASLPDRVKKQRITLTFTSASAFDVTTDAGEGAELLDLPSGTVGTAYAAPNRYSVGFTVYDGEDAWTSGDTIVIDVLPLPVDEDGNGLLEGGYLYYDVGSDSRASAQIGSNTSNTITLTAAPGTIPDEAETAAQAGNSIDTGALTFPLTLTDTSLGLFHSTFGPQTLTIAAGPHANAAALAAAINSAWQTASSSTGDIASDGGSTNVLITTDDSGADTEVGLESFVIVDPNDPNSELNLAGLDGAVGTPGAEWRVQAGKELRDGYDGQDPGDTEYLAAAATPSTSLLTRFFGQNKGLVKIATPGYNSTVVQKAYLALAEAFSYQYRIEVPSGTTDDSVAVAYVNDTIGRNDFGKVHFPSYGYVPNPRGEGVVLRTLTGQFHGREALVAANYEGYHKVAGGVDVTLPGIVRLPTGDRVLNEEILNPQGINVVKKLRGNFVMWGARTIALDPAWRWAQQRETLSHYERQILENFDWIIFAINDPIEQQSLITAFRAFFLPEWRKRALRGDSFEQAVSIKIDSEINTDATRAAGDLNAELKLRLADTVERFKVRISKAGIFEDLG